MIDESKIENKLEQLGQNHLLRTMRPLNTPQGRWIEIEGREYLNFASNDYLNLANDPRIKQAVIQGVERWGVGSGASRYVVGHMQAHEDLEHQLADWLQRDAALLLSTGYMANVGVLPALVGKGDILFLDRLCHASLIDGARLSGAKIVIVKHNDSDHLEYCLKTYRSSHEESWIVCESIYSMDGDLAPLKAWGTLAKQYQSGFLVDEAHALGVRGLCGAGRVIEEGAQDLVDLCVGTLGKAIGLSGGFIAGNTTIINMIRNKIRSNIYSTGMSPAWAYALSEALSLAKGLDQERKHLSDLVQSWPKAQSHVIPFYIYSNKDVLKTMNSLQDSGFYVPAMRYPTVKKGKERLRISLTSAHSMHDLQELKMILMKYI